MKNLENLFNTEEYVELAKKNVEFAMDMFKRNLNNNQSMVKDGVAKYFDLVNENLELISENYDKAVSQGSEIADLYKENIEKTYTISKDMFEKVKNYKA